MGLRVIIEGFGGQGVKSAGDLLVTTMFHMGHRAQGMPIYSPLQMGGLVTYSLAIDPNGDRVVPQRDRDVFVMMHRRLFTRQQAETVKPGGLLLVNAAEPPAEILGLGRRVAVLDADRVARQHGLARANVPNLSTAMTGAFARLCGVVDYAALEGAVREAFPRLITPNLRALRAGYESVRQADEPAAGAAVGP
ncbi:MAG: 2-oxoacid:acceptor oxidoreductase family protein [Candidatus Latescibacterota bacterium]